MAQPLSQYFLQSLTINNTPIPRDIVIALRVPSALSPVEFNYLLNPSHPDCLGIEKMQKRSLSDLIPG